MVSTHHQHTILQVLDVRLDLCMSELTLLMFSIRVVSINGGFTEGGRLNAASLEVIPPPSFKADHLS